MKHNIKKLMGYLLALSLLATTCFGADPGTANETVQAAETELTASTSTPEPSPGSSPSTTPGLTATPDPSVSPAPSGDTTASPQPTKTPKEPEIICILPPPLPDPKVTAKKGKKTIKIVTMEESNVYVTLKRKIIKNGKKKVKKITISAENNLSGKVILKLSKKLKKKDKISVFVTKSDFTPGRKEIKIK